MNKNLVIGAGLGVFIVLVVLFLTIPAIGLYQQASSNMDSNKAALQTACHNEFMWWKAGNISDQQAATFKSNGCEEFGLWK